MSNEMPIDKKSIPRGWIIVGIVAFVFIGARQLYPGGIRALLGDFITEARSSTEAQVLQNKILNTLKPIGAGLICLKEHNDDPALRIAIESFNSRNENAMKKLIISIRAAGDVSSTEKSLLDRQAMREARSFVGKGIELEHTCNDLAGRFNSREFDIN